MRGSPRIAFPKGGGRQQISIRSSPGPMHRRPLAFTVGQSKTFDILQNPLAEQHHRLRCCMSNPGCICMWEKGVKGSVKDAAVALSLKQQTSVFQLRSQVGTTQTCMCAHHFCRAGSSAGNDRGTTVRALLCAVEPPHSKKAHRFDSLFCVKFACFPRVCMGSFQVFRVLLQFNLFAVFPVHDE